MSDCRDLPPVEAVAGIADAELPGFVLKLAALQAAVAARLTTGTVPDKGTPNTELPYTVLEAASLLRKSRPWLQRQARAGAIPCAKKVGKSWLFPRAEFDRFRARRVIG